MLGKSHKRQLPESALIFFPCRPLTVNTVWKMDTINTSVTHDEFIWDRRRNLHGQEIHVSFVLYKPFFFYEEDTAAKYNYLEVRMENGTVANLTGESLFKVELLAEDMNFTTVWHEQFIFAAYDSKTGTWSGMVGEVASGTEE